MQNYFDGLCKIAWIASQMAATTNSMVRYSLGLERCGLRGHLGTTYAFSRRDCYQLPTSLYFILPISLCEMRL